MHEWHCVGPASVEGNTDTKETTFVNKQLQMNKRKTQANKREGRYWRRLSLHTTLCYSLSCLDEYNHSVRFNLLYKRLLLSSANGTQMTFSGRGLFAVKPVKKKGKKSQKEKQSKGKNKQRKMPNNKWIKWMSFWQVMTCHARAFVQLRKKERRKLWCGCRIYTRPSNASHTNLASQKKHSQI